MMLLLLIQQAKAKPVRHICTSNQPSGKVTKVSHLAALGSVVQMSQEPSAPPSILELMYRFLALFSGYPW